MRIPKNSIHIFNRNMSYDNMILLNSLKLTHISYLLLNSWYTYFWIQYHEFRTLNSPRFSVTNSYHEFVFMESDSLIQIWYYKFLHLNSYHDTLNDEFHISIQNLYIWIHIHEFIYSWIHHISNITGIQLSSSSSSNTTAELEIIG